jgi:hypothetical protein
MRRRVRTGLLFLIFVLGAPLTVCAQSHERFSVEPSEPGTLYGNGYVDTEFRFTADVTEAVRYELDFGDGDIQSDLQPDSDGKVVRTHRYARTGRFPAVMRAWRDAPGDPIVLPLLVRVTESPPVRGPAETHALFSVAASDPNVHDDIEVPWADFTFTADVTDAESYELHFGDDIVARDLSPNPDGTVVRRHAYKEPGVFRAQMTAWRNTGEVVENELMVSVLAPPSPAQDATFSVMPSDPKIHGDIVDPWADFTFSADVTEAVRYDFEFGDGHSESHAPTGSTRRTELRHVYAGSGSYIAKIRALRNTGETVEEIFPLLVQAPAAPVKREFPLWLLLLLGIAILLSMVWGTGAVSSGTDLVSFEPSMDAGTVRVTGSATADDTVSMRLRRGAVRTAISVNEE